MFGLALAVVAIALPDSLNPSLIVGAVYLTLGPHATRRIAAFTVGAFAATLAGGLIVAIGLGDLILSVVPKPSRTLKYELMIAVGVLLVVGGAVIWWRREALGSDDPRHRDSKVSGSSAAAMGAGIAGFEFLTAIPYFAALAMVIGSDVSVGSKVFLIVLYNVVYVLPLIAITIASAVMGDRAARVLTPIGDWISKNWPLVVAPLVFVAGLTLTAWGIVHLT